MHERQRGGGRECALAQIKQDSPRGGEQIRQKAIAGSVEQAFKAAGTVKENRERENKTIL